MDEAAEEEELNDERERGTCYYYCSLCSVASDRLIRARAIHFGSGVVVAGSFAERGTSLWPADRPAPAETKTQIRPVPAGAS